MYSSGIDRLPLDPHFARAFLDAGDVDDGHLHRLADLLGGQADPARRAHGIEKVVDESFYFGGDGADFPALGPEHRRVVVDDFPDHGPESPGGLAVSMKVGRSPMPAIVGRVHHLDDHAEGRLGIGFHGHLEVGIGRDFAP
jgi:hypothetical protein